MSEQLAMDFAPAPPPEPRKPTLAELFLDQRIGALRIARMGYGIVEGANDH